MTEQNKQPPVEAGEAVAVVDADAPCGIALTDAGAKLPIGTKLYTSQTTATQAAVAAAVLKAANVIEEWAVSAENAGFDGDAIQYRNLKYDVLASFPAEATAALRELLKDTIRAARQYDYASNNWIHTGSLEDIVDRILAEKGLK
jgi:hypothetical protein